MLFSTYLAISQFVLVSFHRCFFFVFVFRSFSPCISPLFTLNFIFVIVSSLIQFNEPHIFRKKREKASRKLRVKRVSRKSRAMLAFYYDIKVNLLRHLFISISINFVLLFIFLTFFHSRKQGKIDFKKTENWKCENLRWLKPNVVDLIVVFMGVHLKNQNDKWQQPLDFCAAVLLKSTSRFFA